MLYSENKSLYVVYFCICVAILLICSGARADATFGTCTLHNHSRQRDGSSFPSSGFVVVCSDGFVRASVFFGAHGEPARISEVFCNAGAPPGDQPQAQQHEQAATAEEGAFELVDSNLDTVGDGTPFSTTSASAASASPNIPKEGQ